MNGRFRRGAALVVALLCGVVLSAVASAPASARGCEPPEYQGSGYFTSLSVKRVGCATGRRVASAFQRCRTRTGPRGHCRRRVLGYRCTERRTSIPTQLDGRVVCRDGGRRVIHTYQQNT